MKTQLMLHNGKNYEVTTENPRDFKLGDTFLFKWGGITDVQTVDSESIMNEVNGNVVENKDSIDLVFNFWRSVRKVINH